MSKTKCKMSILAAKARRETGSVATVLVPTGRALWLCRRIAACFGYWGCVTCSSRAPEGALVNSRSESAAGWRDEEAALDFEGAGSDCGPEAR